MSSWIASYGLSVILSAYAYKVGVGTPPPAAKSALPDRERADNIDVTPRMMDVFRRTLPYVVCINFVVAFLEAAAAFLMAPGNPLQLNSDNSLKLMAPSLCPTNAVFNPETQPPVMAWTGCLLAILGSMFRIWAIRSLGRFFTYDVSIRPNHKLYTDGPYGIVRHPAYTGAIFVHTGHLLFAFGHGTFSSECLHPKFPVIFHIIRTPIALQALGIIAMCCWRPVTEDKLLKKHFGNEWMEWAGRTRYRLFPGVF